MLRPKIVTKHVPGHAGMVSLNVCMLANDLIRTHSRVVIVDQEYFKWAPEQRRGGFEWYARVVTRLRYLECDLIYGIKNHDHETARCFRFSIII